MTNLLPPAAKKKIVFEYWTRVICAWVILWSVCLFLGSALLFPTYKLLVWNNEGQQEIATAATERTNVFAELSSQLNIATRQAEEIVTVAQRPSLSAILADIWGVVDTQTIEVTTVALQLEDSKLKPFSIAGKAADRQSLAKFRDSLETLTFVETVNLPIENLAKNENIEFSLSVTVNNSRL